MSSYSNARYGRRSADSQVNVIASSGISEEEHNSYRRHLQQDRYLEAMRKRSRRRKILVILIAAVIAIALAFAAGFLVFRGVVGSEMALRNSDARDALSASEAESPVYTLIAVELGAVAAPLEQPGPDVIFLLRENPAQRKYTLISLPPSLKVTVDNDTRRLSDMAEGGDAAFISAVESYAKINVNHFLKVDEDGIAGMTDALGGIDITLDQVIDDPTAGDVYYPIGSYTLNGQGALTYLRTSNLRMGKTDQMNNQMVFFKLLLEKLVGYDGGFARSIDAIDSYFQTDLTLNDLEAFAANIVEAGIDSITTSIVPGYFTTSSDVVEDNGELFVSKTSDIAEFIDSIDSDAKQGSQQEDQSSEIDPGSFSLEVLNGTDIAGAAGTTADTLASQGFNIVDVGNAEQQVYNETLVVYRTENTPAAPSSQKEGTDGQTGEVEGYYDEDGDFHEGPAPDRVDGASQSASSNQTQATDLSKMSDEEVRSIGEARANKVIASLGMGRAVEGDVYYSFNADVLLIIGYDYKPVS